MAGSKVERCMVEDVRPGRAIFFRAPLVGVVAHAVLGADEDHTHRAQPYELHPVVGGAAGLGEGEGSRARAAYGASFRICHLRAVHRKDVVVDRPQQEDEQRLREVMCERGSVGVRCHDWRVTV